MFVMILYHNGRFVPLKRPILLIEFVHSEADFNW